MELGSHLTLVLAACALDAVLGDPVYRWHPIRLIGHWALVCEHWLFARGRDQRLAGALHLVLVVAAALAVWWTVHWLFGRWHPWAAWAWDLFVAYSLLCLRDLLHEGRRVLAALGDIDAARQRLTRLVSRDTATLDRGAVVRAAIESLAENLTDGVLTPLWALCLFGLPGLIVVKAVSTLDSMVGYANPRYRYFGWAAARADDLLHWLPARLSVPVIALAATLLRLDPRRTFRTALRWHGATDSPNSGWAEAAVAGALSVRLVGPIRYRGELLNKDFIGDPSWPADLDGAHLERALRLILVSGLLAIALGLPLALLGPFG